MNNTTKNNLCPLKMSDGRSITDYRPKCIINYELMENMTENNLIKSSYESRMYLQQNAENIIKKEMEKCKANMMPFDSKNKNPIDNVTMPNKYYVTCDNVSCTKKVFDELGLGTSINTGSVN